MSNTIIRCDNTDCQRELDKFKSVLERSKKHFCSKKCYTVYLKGRPMEQKIKERIRQTILGTKQTKKTIQKRRLALKGRTWDKEVYNNRRGKNHANWLGGKSFEDYPQEFDRYSRLEVKERDNYTCQLCLYRGEEKDKNLTVHHIDYDKQNCNINNLIVLCRSCNSKVNADRNFWVKFFTQKIKL